MRGFIIMLCVFLIVLSVVIFEEIYIRKVSQEITLLLENDSMSNFYIETVLQKWNTKRRTLEYFVDKSYLERITLDLITAKEYLIANNDLNYKAYASRAKERIENLPRY